MAGKQAKVERRSGGVQEKGAFGGGGRASGKQAAGQLAGGQARGRQQRGAFGQLRGLSAAGALGNCLVHLYGPAGPGYRWGFVL